MCEVKVLRVFFIAVLIILLLASCTNSSDKKKDVVVTESVFDSSLGITSVPENLGSSYTSMFNRYTKVTAPNGGVIHIVAQSQITNEQIVRARGVLEHYLGNYPGSLYGSDKSAVANKMADNKAILLLLNGKDEGNDKVKVQGQPLYYEEMQVEGSSWYINQNYDQHRDATYEEILHLVHDYGIGVDGPNTSPGALPELQALIRAAQKNAVAKNLWGIGMTNLPELDKENSLSQEYLASVIDSYYGLWGAWNGSPTNGMWGGYIAKTRAEIVTEDPEGQKIMDNKYFHPYLTYNARIDKSFTGTFYLKFDSAYPYTHHSRYLKDVTLLGESNVNVVVNELDNNITGNNGRNTVVLSGKRADYIISGNTSSAIVEDRVSGRDGKNTLKSIEKLQFSDETINL